MKKLTWLAAPAALMLGLTACSGGSNSNAGSDSEGGSENLEVMLSYHQSIYWLPLLIAEDRGYFAHEGITVDLLETEGSGFVTQQLIAGNAPAGWAGAADNAIAFTRDDSLRALMCNPPQNIFRIVVPADSDVSSVEDLEGRVLGITEVGGGEEPIVNAALADAGLERGKNVEVLPIGAAGPASLNAILDGTVDAYATSYPDISALTADGQLTLRDITPEEYNAIPGDCLVVQESSLTDHETRAQLVGLARAWAKGAVFAAANPQAATVIACKIVPQECKDMAFAERYVQDTINLSGVTDGSVPFGAVPLSAWETTFRVLLDSGSIEGDFDPAELGGGELVTDFVEDYSDFDVAEIQTEAMAYDGS